MKQLNGFFVILMAGMIAFVLSGCASVPPESAELSAELGKQIAIIETSNLALLKSFFDMKREQVDRFMETEWVPLFAENYFKKDEVEVIWQQVVESGNAQDRLEFVIRTGPALQQEINNKRLALIQPLDDLERDIERKIREEYTRARLVNNTITGFLMSAAEVTETRKKYLEMAGISDEKVNDVVDKVNSTLEDLLVKGMKLEDVTDKSSVYVDKIKTITDLL